MARSVGSTLCPLILLPLNSSTPASCLLLTPIPGQEQGLSWEIQWGQGAQPTLLSFLLALPARRKRRAHSVASTKQDDEQPSGAAAGRGCLAVAYMRKLIWLLHPSPVPMINLAVTW